MDSFLIAPCGMNCGLCLAYQRERNTCCGCRGNDAAKPNSCAACIIKNCEELKNTKSKFCFECNKYPCKRLKNLDKRYTGKYNMSMLENLAEIRDSGLDEFIKKQKEKWTCFECGGTICVHRAVCLKCHPKENKTKKVLK